MEKDDIVIKYSALIAAMHGSVHTKQQSFLSGEDASTSSSAAYVYDVLWVGTNLVAWVHACKRHFRCCLVLRPEVIQPETEVCDTPSFTDLGLKLLHFS